MSRESLELVTADLDPADRAQLAVDLIDELNGDALALVGVALVRRIDALAKVDPIAADQLAMAVAATFRDWSTVMAGALTAAIEATP